MGTFGRTNVKTSVFWLMTAAVSFGSAHLVCAGNTRTSLLAPARREFQRGEELLTIARDGTAAMVIVTPAEAPAPVRFAAEELKAYLDRMTGAEFRIVPTPPPDGKAFVLGDCPAVRQVGVDVNSIARDGYAIRTVGPTVYIAGRDDGTAASEILTTLRGDELTKVLPKTELYPALSVSSWDFDRGTLYGVYRLLEELGVRWFFPGTRGEVVPMVRDLTLRAFSLLEEPHYILRHVGSDRWVLSRVARSKFPHVNPAEYRELGWTGRVNRLWLLRMRGSSPWFAFNHRPPRLRWEERFGAEHPEYFALLPDGSRDFKRLQGGSRRTGHLCYTSREMYGETLNDVSAYFTGQTAGSRGIPEQFHTSDNRGWGIAASYGDSVSMLPHDSFRACQCPACRPLQHPEADRWVRDSGLVWPFVSRLADEVLGRFPEKLVFCLAYSSYTAVPDGMARLPDNVMVGLCPHIGPRKHNKTYNLTTLEARQRVVQLAERWHGVNSLPLLGWFHHLYGYATKRCGVPMLIPHTLAALSRDLTATTRLMHVEFDPDFIILEHINRYVLQRVLFNPDEDVDALLDDYCERFYGPASGVIRPLLTDLESRCVALTESDAGQLATWETHFPEPVIRGYRQAADKAVKLTEGTAHADAAEVFSRYFVGAMERGFALYVRTFRDVANSPAARVTARRAAGAIVVDGALSEPGWQPLATGSFLSNVSGKPTEPRTELRLLYDAETLYVAFVGHDPKAPTLPTVEGACDYVEIFLDPDRDRSSYYWLMVDLAARVTAIRFPGGSAAPDTTWQSGVKAAAAKHADRWVLEVALPRRAMQNGQTVPANGRWGANFCRTQQYPPTETDRFSGTSPLLRGKFHQPDLFGYLVFGE